MWRNVLLVDDDQIVLEGLKKFVNWKDIGYQVCGALPSAHRAVRFIEQNPVDVLLTDIVMTGADGFELIHDARLVNPYIKTVVLSSYSTFRFAKKAIQLGTFDYLSKPVNLDELKALFVRLRAVLDRENSQRDQMIRLQKKYLKERPDVSGGAKKEVGPVIGKVLRYIDFNYREELTLQKLAELVYVHPVYLSRLFKEKAGVNFIDYLTRVRVKNAERLLGNPALRIYDISGLVGYESPKHFAKVFREVTGLTPTEYRKRLSPFGKAERAT